MKKAVIYCRVSTTKQSKDWDSLQSQEDAWREYCERNNMKVVWVYKDSCTWSTADRPQLNLLFSFLKVTKEKIDYCIVKNIDRNSRWGIQVHDEIKSKLFSYGVQLKDTYWVIQDRVKVVNTMWDLDYWFLYNDPSKISEAVAALAAEEEKSNILRRTIPKEHILESQGYKVRQANFWYRNKRVPYGENGKATIQVRDGVEWVWIEEIFNKRAEWKYTDEEIVNHVNDLWYQSRKWNKLTIKQMQCYIKSLIYAGIIVSKWTDNKPIRTAYKGLIDISIWNKANRWKIKIIEIDKKEVKIEYNVKNQKKINQPIIRNRKSYNPFYCYAKVLKCPECGWALTGSTSKWRNWAPHHYYVCTGKGVNVEKHSTYSLKRNEVHKTLQQVFTNTTFSSSTLKLYDKIIAEVYNERISEHQDNIVDYKKHMKNLYVKEAKILSDIDKVIDYPHLLKAKNTELEEIKLEIKNLLWKTDELENPVSLEKFQYYCKKLIQHLDKLVEQTNRPDLIALVFEIVFNWKIEYEKIIYPTTKTGKKPAILKQKKSSNNENFSSNLLWQAN